MRRFTILGIGNCYGFVFGDSDCGLALPGAEDSALGGFLGPSAFGARAGAALGPFLGARVGAALGAVWGTSVGVTPFGSRWGAALGATLGEAFGSSCGLLRGDAGCESSKVTFGLPLGWPGFGPARGTLGFAGSTSDLAPVRGAFGSRFAGSPVTRGLRG